MSGPAGAGRQGHGTPLVSRLNLHKVDSAKSTASAGFGGLVHNLVKKKQSGQEDDPDPNGMEPSKGLPSTGLKRNTQEWKDRHGDEGDGEERELGRRRSRASSSSSIPSDARADDTPEKEDEQEGALGRGPGKHEERIANGDDYGTGRIMDSPTEEKESDLKHNSPPVERGQEESMIPGSANHQDGSGAGRDGGHREVDDGRRTDDRIEEDDKEEGGSNRLTWKGDAEERVLSRDAEPMKRLTDEMGNYPLGLKGVKGEEPPGPRTEIVLDPRITHIHVSRLALDM